MCNAPAPHSSSPLTQQLQWQLTSSSSSKLRQASGRLLASFPSQASAAAHRRQDEGVLLASSRSEDPAEDQHLTGGGPLASSPSQAPGMLPLPASYPLRVKQWLTGGKPVGGCSPHCPQVQHQGILQCSRSSSLPSILQILYMAAPLPASYKLLHFGVILHAISI